ncbi:MAG: hypothetical protein ABSB84_09700 [Verrucomicrobiota bacterium]|jgi:hypothetical protein
MRGSPHGFVFLVYLVTAGRAACHEPRGSAPGELPPDAPRKILFRAHKQGTFRWFSARFAKGWNPPKPHIFPLDTETNYVPRFTE